VCAADSRNLCVLLIVVASLHSPDCDTDWLICINVATGKVYNWKISFKALWLFAFDRLISKNVNQYVSLYRKLAISTEL
jgi:hypothetical protein